MLSCSAIYRSNLIVKSICASKSLGSQVINNSFHHNYYNKDKPLFICSRWLHQSQNSDKMLLSGCEDLPDLTLIWPFHLWPSDIVANSLNQIQLTSGLPWWCTILVGGAILKVPLFGFNVYNFRRMQQAFVTSPRQLTHFVLTYFNNLVTKGEVQALKMANNERRFTIFREGMNWEKSLKIQMFSHISYAPIYWLVFIHISMFTGMHWLNRIKYIPLMSGGLPWCLDLTSVDSYMILPVICLMTGLLNIYLHPMHWLFPLPDISIRQLMSLPVLPVLAVIVSVLSSLPADYILYMISANLTSCILNYSIKSPDIYREFGLLSSGESLNRFIPPPEVFKELNKTLDRQLLLLKQKKTQNALSQKVGIPQIEDTHQSLIGMNSTSPSANDSVSLSNINLNKKSKDLPELKKAALNEPKPHLNVKKVFHNH